MVFFFKSQFFWGFFWGFFCKKKNCGNSRRCRFKKNGFLFYFLTKKVVFYLSVCVICNKFAV